MDSAGDCAESLSSIARRERVGILLRCRQLAGHQVQASDTIEMGVTTASNGIAIVEARIPSTIEPSSSYRL